MNINHSEARMNAMQEGNAKAAQMYGDMRQKLEAFEKDLAALINTYDVDGLTGTPDFIVAKMLVQQVATFSLAVRSRDHLIAASSPTPAANESRILTLDQLANKYNE
jgi:hypothetical protein